MSPPCPTTEYQSAAPLDGELALAPVLSPTALAPHAIASAFAQSSFAGPVGISVAHEPSSALAAGLYST